jgi:hypothetical protein
LHLRPNTNRQTTTANSPNLILQKTTKCLPLSSKSLPAQIVLKSAELQVPRSAFTRTPSELHANAETKNGLRESIRAGRVRFREA